VARAVVILCCSAAVGAAVGAAVDAAVGAAVGAAAAKDKLAEPVVGGVAS
jgi:hypothetical protein